MKRLSEKCLRTLLRSATAFLALFVSLADPSVVFAADESSATVPEELPAAMPEEIAASVSEESVEANQFETQAAVVEEAPVTAEEQPSEIAVTATVPDEPSGTVSEDVPEVTLEVIPEETADISDDPAPAAAAGDALSATAEDDIALTSAAAGTIHIGSTSFSPDDEDAFDWSEGKGWMNVAGQYVAMVDYDGSKAEISTDGDVLTLAVAGINRIKALKGDCSFQIIGTGIVLIDSIDIPDGRTVTLHPNTALYDEGSAAVFLLQDDGSYLLINGGVTGILDEEYILDGLRLVLSYGSCLKIGAMTIRTEVWTPEGAQAPVTEITRYMTDVPESAAKVTHENATYSLKNYGAKVVIGENSSITVEDGATLLFTQFWNKAQNYYGEKVQGDLVIEGQLNVEGNVDHGCITIQNGGSLVGTGTVCSADVQLQPTGSLSNGVIFDGCTLTIDGDGSEKPVPITVSIRDCVVSLTGSGVDISDLNVLGSCMLCIDTVYNRYLIYRVGNITLGSGSHLDILANDHEYTLSSDWHGFPYRLLEDCYLEIYGEISGGAVNVLTGCVKYTGTETAVVPVVPEGFASRVYIENGTAISDAEVPYPLNMTQAEASARVALDSIPVMGLTVMDTWPYDDGSIPARKWVASAPLIFSSLSRENDKQITVSELLRRCGLINEEGRALTSYFLGVELIYSDFNRSLHLYGDTNGLTTQNVIMVRVLQCYWDGGAGGSASTHTVTNFTGSGVLGGVGSGSAKAGGGSVVYGKAAEKETNDPEQENQEPKESEQNKANRTNTNQAASRRAADQSDSGMTTASEATATFVATVSPLERKGASAKDGFEKGSKVSLSEADEKLPQIWQLVVTNEGTPVTNLSGGSVRVAFEFAIPEDWGDSEEVAKDSLYAVFVDDEGNLTAYEAHYDPETGEIWFEAEQTGCFVIVRFTYGEEQFVDDLLGEEMPEDDAAKDKLFTEYFYRALGELKEIQDFIEVLKEESLIAV